MNIDGELARTIVAVAGAGTLDAAAAELHVTPSAVSQRIKALESLVGRPVLHRTRPVELTVAGAAVLRYARQLELLGSDLAAELQPQDAPLAQRLAIVVNADSLHTWALAPLVEVSTRAQLELVREDEGHSIELLRAGQAAGAVTTQAQPATGCSCERLGAMRYLAVCSPAYRERWFADGVAPASLGAAPLVCFDRKDDLQDRCLARLTRAALAPPRHHVPASAEFAEAIRLGIGWGMVPEIEATTSLSAGTLVRLHPRAAVDVTLYWQQWRRGSATLDAVGASLRRAAAAALR